MEEEKIDLDFILHKGQKGGHTFDCGEELKGRHWFGLDESQKCRHIFCLYEYFQHSSVDSHFYDLTFVLHL